MSKEKKPNSKIGLLKKTPRSVIVLISLGCLLFVFCLGSLVTLVTTSCPRDGLSSFDCGLKYGGLALMVFAPLLISNTLILILTIRKNKAKKEAAKQK
jgi:hypothetical protein